MIVISDIGITYQIKPGIMAIAVMKFPREGYKSLLLFPFKKNSLKNDAKQNFFAISIHKCSYVAMYKPKYFFSNLMTTFWDNPFYLVRWTHATLFLTKSKNKFFIHSFCFISNGPTILFILSDPYKTLLRKKNECSASKEAQKILWWLVTISWEMAKKVSLIRNGIIGIFLGWKYYF